MKQFFKFTFASMLGFIIGSIVLVFLFAGIIGGIAAGFSNEPTEITVDDNSVLHL
jgi:protease-4